jgi:predicted DNA binding CopG/RHH family protein
MEVIFIRIESQEKRDLRREAKKLGMPLTTYCRMVLINSLKNKGENEK